MNVAQQLIKAHLLEGEMTSDQEIALRSDLPPRLTDLILKGCHINWVRNYSRQV